MSCRCGKNNKCQCSVSLSQERIAICRDCAFYRSFLKQCKKCGCVMPLKVMIKASKCPIGKW